MLKRAEIHSFFSLLKPNCWSARTCTSTLCIPYVSYKKTIFSFDPLVMLQGPWKMIASVCTKGSILYAINLIRNCTRVC